MGGPPLERARPDSRRSARGQRILSLPRRLSDRLLRELARGTGLVLILDFDGTLTPIVPSPDAAYLATSVRRTLQRLAMSPRARLAILSGRSLRDIKGRVGLRNVVYGGCHGLEVSGPGLRFRHPLASARALRVRAVARDLARQLARVPGAFLEFKGLSVSLHYRQAPRRWHGDIVRIAAQVERRAPGLMLLPGEKVLEFLPRVDWGKGEAVRWIAKRLASTLRPRRTVILYAGNDAMDEAAFAALKGRGITIRVGARRGGAEYAVKSVRGIHTLLRWLSRAIA